MGNERYYFEGSPSFKRRFYYLLLGVGTIYTSTLLTIYNLTHINYSSFMSYLFLFVHAIWYVIIFNHAVTLMRLYYYRDLPYQEISNQKNLPTITLATVFYKEPDEVIEQTVQVLRKIDYPKNKLKIVAVEDLDGKESARKYFEQLKSEGLNLEYVTRNNRRGYRGGALNEVLKQTDTKYLVVLDIDHMPLPHILKRLAAYAESNPQYDVIMFPQRFRNWNTNSITLASHVGYVFDYEVSRKGKSVTNSAFCVGTNWIAKVESIKKAGGFDENSIVEDMATSMKLWHPYGLKIGLANEVLACGLVPDTLRKFRKQQFRWANGAFDMFKTYLKNFLNFSFFQKFDYIFFIMWYLVGISSIVSQFFPLSTVLGFNFLVVTDFYEYLFIVIALTILQVMLFALPLVASGYNLAATLKSQSVGLLIAETYTKALISSLIGRKIPFVITPKAAKKQSMLKLIWESKLIVFLLAVNILVILFCLADLSLTSLVTMFWSAYNSSWCISALYNISLDILSSDRRNKLVKVKNEICTTYFNKAVLH